MDYLRSFLYHININTIFELLSFIGLFCFLIRRFVLHKSPVPKSAFKAVPKELLQECVSLLRKREKKKYEPYVAPEEIISALQADLGNEVHLKELLCSICAHLGIDGSFIKLVVENDYMPDRAGEIATDLAFTTIKLELRPRYTLDAVIAVLAHEATHLHLYYEGIRMRDTWENEVLTDTAAVYCGFGNYIYKGYALMQGEFAFSYHKVGYISQEDVKYIETLMQNEIEK
ncbi:MAG: hypothetical protein K2N55_05705 [Lachnospiraceae bacterium]|nr:hypothetical protein [Lachnospiraceae bacterium]